MPSTIILYHTDGCHLCEQAEALLCSAKLDYQMVDIVSEPSLVARYKVRIPVVVITPNHELGWPFDQQQLQQFVQEHSA